MKKPSRNALVAGAGIAAVTSLYVAQKRRQTRHVETMPATPMRSPESRSPIETVTEAPLPQEDLSVPEE